MRPRELLLLWVPVAISLLLIAGCASGGEEEAATTVADPATTDTTATMPSVALPEPGEPWDLLVISHALDLGDQFLEMYTQRAEEALGVEVNAQYSGGLDQFAWEILGMLRNEAYPGIGDLARDAEIIVLIAFEVRSDQGEPTHIDVDGEHCSFYVSTQTPTPPAPTTAEYWQPYTDLLDDIYTEIWKLREGTPTVLIAPDLHNRFLARQRDAGIDAECVAWTEAWSAVVRDAAERNGAAFVSLADLLSGPDHDIDAFEAGYTGASEQYPTIWWGTPNEIGTPMIVEAVAAAGFEPVTQP